MCIRDSQKGMDENIDATFHRGYQKGMAENIDATFQSGYEKGKTAGYCKGYTSGMQEGQQQGKSTAVSSEQIPHAKPHRQKRKCPSCGYAFVGLRQHAWAAHDLDLSEEDYPLVEE